MSVDDNKSRRFLAPPTFDGSESNFETFWPRWESYAVMKGFEEAICIDPEDPDLPGNESNLSADADTKKKEEAALKRNKTAMAAYTLAFTEVAQMNMIHKAKDSNYPKGKANRVTKQLIKRHCPVDRISTVEAKTALRKVRMLSSDTPDNFINKLSAVQNKYVKAGALTDDDLLTEAIVKVPADYKSLVAGAVARLSSSLTLEDLREIMSQQYRMEHNTLRVDDDEEEGDETTLNSNDVCYNCGKPGHKSYQCKSPRKGQGNGNGQRGQNMKKKFTGTCNNCGKVGHKKADCWELEENKGKRPKNWKSKVESGNAAGDTEYLLLCCDVDVDGAAMPNDSDSSDDELVDANDDEMSLGDDEDPAERMYDLYSSGADGTENGTDDKEPADDEEQQVGGQEGQGQARANDFGAFDYAAAAVQG